MCRDTIQISVTDRELWSELGLDPGFSSTATFQDSFVKPKMILKMNLKMKISNPLGEQIDKLHVRKLH